MNVRYEIQYRPGALAKMCAMQTQYYAREWGFNHIYEAVVSADIGEFLQRYDPQKDIIVLALRGNEIVGGVVIDGGDGGGRSARLRWYIVSEESRGFGVGRALIERAMEFIRVRQYENVFLTTFDGLYAARSMYEKAGFRLVEERAKNTWGKAVMEQRFEKEFFTPDSNFQKFGLSP